MPAPLNNVQNVQPNNQTPTQTASAGATSVASEPQLVPFIRAARDHIEPSPTQNLTNSAWSAGNASQVYYVPSYGFLEGLVLSLQGVNGALNGSTSVGESPDAPWDLLTSIIFADANGTPIHNLPGYSTYLSRLLGGYRPFRPDQSQYGYDPIDQSSGAGKGTGNFLVKYELFQGFGPDGLGCLPNMDGSALYTVKINYNSPANFYNGQPGTLPSINGVLEGLYRSRPPATNSFGDAQSIDPPAKGTVQYWTSQFFQVQAGQNNFQLTRVGNLIRNHILVFRDANGSRAAADSTGVTPTSIMFYIDASIRYNVLAATQRQLNYEAYQFDMPSGVIAFPYTLDPTGIAGHEYGDSYLPTAASTTLKLQFTSSAPGSLEVITNDIVPAGDLYPAIANL